MEREHKACDCPRAEKAALRLIARAEQSYSGLSRKLEKRGYEKDCIDRVLSVLVEMRILDDHRFVRLWLESRLSRRTDSPRRLLSSLCARGIERDDAQSGLKTALDTETEWELLTRYVKKLEKSKSFRKGTAVSTSSRGTRPVRPLKLILKSEGFSPRTIQRFCELED